MTRAAGIEGTYKLPDSAAGDLEQMGSMIAEVQAGELSLERFRAFRVPMGIYEQREDGTYMLRVRFPAGGVLPHQMRTLADVSELHGNGVLHVTTRQDIQVHNVPLESVHPAEVELLAAGLATKGGGGNTVRNITACPHAGVCPREAFDVTPHAIVATEFLLPPAASYQLPRKYKLAFSGCLADCAGATVNDLGLIAKQRDGQHGFTVYVGGGMGARSRLGHRLEEFVPVGDVPLIAEAVKRVFDQHGNRKNKHRARLRFLIGNIGLDAFRKLYEAELRAVRSEAPPVPELRPVPRVERPQATVPAQTGPAFEAWRETCTEPQKQDGCRTVTVALPLGDITARALLGLAGVVEAHGEGMLRTTQTQNAVIRWVAEGDLPDVHRTLDALGLASAAPRLLRDLVACTGAATCRLGICLSRGLACAIARELDGEDLDGLGDARVHINGCPNACGREPIAPIGFVGAARRIGSRLVPHYVVQLGGRVGEGVTRLAEGRDSVPARAVPAFLRDFLQAYAQSEQCPDFHAYLDAGGRQVAADLAAQYRTVPAFEDDESYYTDWSADELFSLAGRGPGECSAGVFDLIAVDLASAREALADGRLFAAAALACRALLVTRGEEPRDDADAFALFRKHFVAEKLVDARFDATLAAGLDGEAAFAADAEQVSALVNAVQALYDRMDDSLRFSPPAPPAPEPADEPEPDATEDLRTVACPLNYVRIKLALEELGPGQTLRALLNDEGATNCPLSAQADGHEIVSASKEGDHWGLVIRKDGG